jgi:3-deoxy-manno-octulosonate cytidylyltransferase (CMP-KDO synthetase)
MTTDSLASSPHDAANAAPQAAPNGRVLGVIPARLASTRLPRKVLLPLAGKPLLEWVYLAAARCTALDELVVATDAAEVQQLCHDRGWHCVMTSPELASGTDRLCAVAQQIDADIYVNIQGDEPLLQPAHIRDLLAPFSLGRAAVTTLKVRCSAENIHNPNAVKVVTAADGRALYFSRASIPYAREAAVDIPCYKHLGLYAYRRAALERFAALPPSGLERIEKLEQLRLLENGMDIYVTETQLDTIGVDTAEDLVKVEKLLLAAGS